MQRKFLLLVCCFMEAICMAQPNNNKTVERHGQYPFVHYTPKDGLISSRVRKAWQDSKGRMYFLTYSGLSMYDGARFRSYTPQDGLLIDLANDMLEVGPDSFLVAVNTGGLNALVNGKIKTIKLEGPGATLNQFFRDQQGTIYATSDEGLFRIEGTRITRCVTHSAFSPNEILYLGLIAGAGDHLIFYTNDLRSDKLLYLFNKKTSKVEDVSPVGLFDLQNSSDGTIWICTHNGLYTIDSVAMKNGKIELKKYPLTGEAANIIPNNILFGQQGEMLFFSAKRGSLLCHKDGTQLYIPSPGPGLDIVQSAFLDREGVLWICYDGNGVYKLSNTKLQTKEVFYEEETGNINSITGNGTDSTWFILANNRWMLQTADQKRIFTANPSIENPTLLRSTGSDVYAVTTRDLLVAPLPSSSNVLHFRSLMQLPDTSSFGLRSTIDPAGNLLVHERNGLWAVNRDGPIASYPIHYYDLVEGVHIGRHGKLWLVTRGSGLQMLSLHPEDPARYFVAGKSFGESVEGGSPRCSIMDKNGHLWIGTRYNGLFCLEINDVDQTVKMLYHFTRYNGLTDNFVVSLTCDNANNIIVGTQTGLDRLIQTVSGFRPENITKSNNVFHYINSVWSDAHGNAYGFTNTRSILQVTPPVASSTDLEPQLLIENIRINGESIPVTESGTSLAYYQRNIVFSVAAPTFIDEKQVQYSYRLRGSGNNEWSEPGDNADISLLNLAPGNYVMEVRASFPSTSYSSKEIAYAFKIRPPWWQTWWFRIALALLIVTTVMFVIRFYYRRKLEKEKAVLERKQAIEKERTRIATDMHDDLGAGLSRIKFLSETIGLKKQMQQPIEEDINSIRQYSHEMIDKMGEIVWALNEKNDSLSDLLSYTRAYAAAYLEQNGIRCSIESPDQFPSVVVSGEYRRNIYLTVKEALHNVVKHSQATEVVINIRTDDKLVIIIHDNGSGFSATAIRPYSNGLTNMQKRMTDIGGRLEIKSNGGTTVTLEASLS
jgi:signal transduction histidine kinase/ligand-binding sensor domain-containing protein